MMEFSLDGREFVLRDLQPTDVEEYLVFFNELGEESIRCRFGHLLAKLTRAAAEQRTDTNKESEKALAIFDRQQKRMVAVGRCYLNPTAEGAEIALVVSETTRRLGLGRFLLRQLIQIARDGNSRSAHAFVATRNAPIIRLLRSAGFVAQPSDGAGDLQLILQISPHDQDDAKQATDPLISDGTPRSIVRG